MYRYLFEEKCFSRVFGANRKINRDFIKKFRETIARNLEIEDEDVKLNYYKNTKEELEIRLEATKEISKNFVFRVILNITEKGVSLISLDTYISRVVPIYIVGLRYVEDVIYNIMNEFSKSFFYQDLMARYKLKYEEISKKIYEDLETLFGFSPVS